MDEPRSRREATLRTEDITQLSSAPDAGRLRLDTTVALLAHGASLLVPLLTVPYLARILQPAAWGEVLTVQSLAAWSMMVLDFGFDLGAVRATAAARDDAAALDRVVSGVQSAKVLVLMAATALVWSVARWYPVPVRDGTLVLWAIVFAVARGLNPFWYFQGLGRFRAALLVETLSKVGAAAAVFVVVRTPADGWRVLQLQAIGASCALGILSVALWRSRPALTLDVRAGITALRETVQLFAFRLSSGLYSQANAALMSRVAADASVSLFGGPERIVRAGVNLLQPVTMVFLPRVAHLRVRDARDAHAEIRRLLVALGGLGVVAAIALAVAAPLVIRVMLGPAYEAAIPVFRILVLLLPLTAVGTVLGLHWAIPFGRERGFLAAVMVAGAVNFVMVPSVVRAAGASGMAWCAVMSEAIVTTVLAILYLRDRDVRTRAAP